MTRDTFRIGAVPIAALVVLSVVAGSVTFAGSVAAVDTVAVESPLSPSTVDEQIQTEHSFNYSADGVNTSGNTTLTLSIPSAFTVESEDVEMTDADGTVLNGTAAQVGNDLVLTANSSTQTVYLSGNVTLESPAVNSDQTYDVEFNASDEDGTSDSLTETLTVEEVPDLAISGSQFDPTTVDHETENRHSFNYTITGVNTSTDTTFEMAIPGEFSVESGNVEVKDASGNVEASTAPSGSPVSITASPSTETAYFAGSVNLTSPAVPEGQDEETYTATVDVNDDNEQSDSTTQDITVQYAGGQPGDPQFLSAIQYVQSDGTPVIEVAFSEDVQNFDSNYGLYVDEDDEVTSDIVTDVSEAQGRVIIELDETDSRDLTLRLDDGITDPDGNALANPGDKSVTFAPTSVTAGGSVNAYEGSIVSVVASSSNTDVTFQGTDDDTDSYFFEGSTGVNSRIFLFDTEGEELGDYEADIAGESPASVTLRNLDLSIAVEDRNVTTLQTIDGTVSARTSNREIRLELLDDNDDVVDEQPGRLSGQGEYEFSYDLESMEIEPGEYALRATDTTSGISVESGTIEVIEAGDTRADLPDDVIQEHRGDVAAIPIELENTREATLTVGDDEAGYEASVTVRDAGGDDRDGRVTVYFNSYAASRVTGTFEGENDLFSVGDDDEVVRGEVTDGVPDLLDAEAYPLSASAEGRETDVQLLVLDERNTTAVRTWTAPRNRYNDLDDAAAVREGEGEWITRTSDVAVGDTVVYEIRASGVEGALDARGEDTVTSEFFEFANGTASDPAAVFSVELPDPGPNQDPLLLELNSSNSRVVADSANDSYYVVTRTGSSGPDGVEDADGDGAIDPSENQRGTVEAGDDLRATFTVYGDDENDLDLTASGDDETVETTHSLVEPEIEMNDPFNVTEASGQEIYGEATVAPGTELRIRVRSGENVRPAFLKTETTTVDPDGQFLATLSFNDTSPGDTYTITVDDVGPAPELTVDGTVQAVIPTATTDTPAETTIPDTPTTTTTTETPANTTTEATTTEIPTVQTPTTTPGFGALAALVALAGAALLALRRE